MADTKIASSRPDLDIEHDINELLHAYAPLRHDRHRVNVSVVDGHIVVSGYVKAIPTYEYLVNNIGLVEGVKSVDHNNLHQDEQIRREVGRLMPLGIQVNVEYGAVILSGKLSPEHAFEDLVEKVSQVPGVNRVVGSLVGDNV